MTPSGSWLSCRIGDKKEVTGADASKDGYQVRDRH